MLGKRPRGTFSYPIDIILEAKDDILKLARGVNMERGSEFPMPVLGVLVSTSPIDAALHDAFGRVDSGHRH